MVDHRRTPSQRAYQLPGWFFVLTAVLSLLAFVVVGWVFLGDRVDPRGATQATGSPSVSAVEPSATQGRPTSSVSTGEATDAGERSGIGVIVLNASQTPRLATNVATVAKEAGWTVGEVGNWVYPAVVNAVYYPQGRMDEAELLADDLGIESVRPVRSGMSDDALTVLLVYSP